MLKLFQRKTKPAHQLVASYDEHHILVYRCAMCHRTFHKATRAIRKDEYCCGKHCYSEHNLHARRIIGSSKDAIPAYLMQVDEIKAMRRTIRKDQEPAAYLRYELIDGLEYIPLYDVRECQELSGAIALPNLEQI